MISPLSNSKRTIHLVSTVPMGKTIFRRGLDKLIRKTRIIPPLHRFGNDFLIPWRYPLRSPHASSRNMLHHLRQFGKIRYYSLHERGAAHLKPGDIFIGQPMPKGGMGYDSRPDTDDPLSVTSATLRKYKDSNHNKYLIVPFANDKILMSWVHDLAKNYADKVILIGGSVWTKDWKSTPFADIDPSKVLRIDNAVDPSEYLVAKNKFNPPARRKFLYIGHVSWYKNTAELERIAATMPGFEGGHIGLGQVKGWKKIAEFADLTPEFMRKIADEYDIFVTTSTADAQATTILENMCFGFPIACTPETGYEYPSIVKLSTTDTAFNIQQLTRLKNMPESEIRKLVADNMAIVKKYHSWKTYVTRISDCMDLHL